MFPKSVSGDDNVRAKDDEKGKKKYDGMRETMYLLQYLVSNSNKDHKVSKAELMSALHEYRFPCEERKIYQPNTYDESVEDKVNSFLESFAGEYIFDFLGLREADESFSGPAISQKKYYVDGPMSEQAICILRDAVSVYPYAEPEITKSIIAELNALASKYNTDNYYKPEIEAEKYPGTYYKNLTEVYKALSTSEPEPAGSRVLKSDYGKKFSKYEKELLYSKEKSKLRLEYCSYQYDNKTNKMILTPRVMKNGQTFREINPLMLLWSNGYYYLVAYYYDKTGKCRYQNLRVDRMRNVSCTNKSVDKYTDTQYNDKEGRDGRFSPRKYISRNPVMYFDSQQLPEVRIRCSNTHINNAIDTFGFDLNVESCDEDDVIFSIRNVSSTGVIMWALEYSNYCEILSPQSLRDEMHTYAEKLLKKYP